MLIFFSSFYLSPNPLITESRELSSTVQLAPGVLLTPFGALQEVRNRVVWADLIAQHSNDLKLNLDTFLGLFIPPCFSINTANFALKHLSLILFLSWLLILIPLGVHFSYSFYDSFISVDPLQFKCKAKQQHDRIIETIDKIDVCSVNTIHSLQKLAKFYDFLIENPLRHFIPPSKNFNNQSYADYEAELTMYIRMATTGNLIKWLGVLWWFVYQVAADCVWIVLSD